MRFNYSHRWVPGWLASREAKEIQDEGAEAILQRVQQIGTSIADTGDYANSLRTEDGKVVSDDPAAHIIEFGSINNQPFAPLRRGAEQVVGTENVR